MIEKYTVTMLLMYTERTKKNVKKSFIILSKVMFIVHMIILLAAFVTQSYFVSAELYLNAIEI